MRRIISIMAIVILCFGWMEHSVAKSGISSTSFGFTMKTPSFWRNYEVQQASDSFFVFFNGKKGKVLLFMLRLKTPIQYQVELYHYGTGLALAARDGVILSYYEPTDVQYDEMSADYPQLWKQLKTAQQVAKSIKLTKRYKKTTYTQFKLEQRQRDDQLRSEYNRIMKLKAAE